jgi:hypothetical protein
MARGAEELSTSGKRAEGAIHLASSANDLLAPTIGPAVSENPVSILKGFGEGLAASKGAGYVAKKAGATGKQQEAIEQLAQFAPMTARAFAESLGLSNPKLGVTSTDQGTGVRIAGEGGTGAGVAVTPEGVHVGGQFKGGRPRSFTIPRGPAASAQPAIEPPTVEGQVVAPAPNVQVTAHLADPSGAPVDHTAEAASNMVAAQNEEAQAMRVASGLPPPPAPPVPPPPGPSIPPEIAQGTSLLTLPRRSAA